MPSPFADALFWVAVSCCVVAELFILRSAFARRAEPAGEGRGTLPRVRRPLEVMWAIVPAVALALVLAATWRALHPVALDPRSPTRAPAPMQGVSAGALT